MHRSLCVMLVAILGIAAGCSPFTMPKDSKGLPPAPSDDVYVAPGARRPSAYSDPQILSQGPYESGSRTPSGQAAPSTLSAAPAPSPALSPAPAASSAPAPSASADLGFAMTSPTAAATSAPVAPPPRPSGSFDSAGSGSLTGAAQKVEPGQGSLAASRPRGEIKKYQEVQGGVKLPEMSTAKPVGESPPQKIFDLSKEPETVVKGFQRGPYGYQLYTLMNGRVYGFVVLDLRSNQEEAFWDGDGDGVYEQRGQSGKIDEKKYGF